MLKHWEIGSYKSGEKSSCSKNENVPANPDSGEWLENKSSDQYTHKKFT